jgi:hypothetical protein
MKLKREWYGAVARFRTGPAPSGISARRTVFVAEMAERWIAEYGATAEVNGFHPVHLLRAPRGLMWRWCSAATPIDLDWPWKPVGWAPAHLVAQDERWVYRAERCGSVTLLTGDERTHALAYPGLRERIALTKP